MKLFTNLILAIILLLALPQLVSATLMKNSDYILRYGNFNSISGSASDDDYNLTFTSGGDIIGLFSGDNYSVRSGFQYIHSVIPFSFSVSSQTISFGILNPGEPIVRTNTLTISNGSAFGFQVTAIEDDLLTNSDGATIPDTTCDDGACNEEIASNWTGLLTYGFGYRCDDVAGTSCSSDFSESDSYFKQFANRKLGEIPGVVMSGKNVGRDIESKVTYKMNISGTQAPGLYQNTIEYIATPTL